MLNFHRFCVGATLVSATLMTVHGTPSVAADLEMVDAFGHITGVIDVSRQGLSVFENSGDRFFYQRAPRFDLPGGRYLGFYNLELNRIIRFPRDGRGPVERADLDVPIPRFVPATVSVRPVGSGPGFGPYLSAWLNQPVGPLYGIGSSSFGWGSYGFVPGTHFYGGFPYGGFGTISGYAFEGIQVNVGPIGLAPSGGYSASRFSPLPPRSVLIDSRIVDKPNRAPAEIEFYNSHNEKLVVSLSDVRSPGKRPQYQLEPGQRQRVKLPRDTGQTRIDVYQTTDIAGQPIEQEVRVDVPAEARFEVVVHRIRIQSIAIDRTGKSPNPIEDINTQGIGIGRFELPPGDQLNSGVIDVFEAARDAMNPGSVAPIPFNR